MLLYCYFKHCAIRAFLLFNITNFLFSIRVKEDYIGYALEERKSKLSQFQELGPPDLISMTKYIPSSSAKDSSAHKRSSSLEPTNTADLHTYDKLKGEIGTFLYCAGVDTSDPTSIAVFLKNMADTISEEPQIWFGKHKNFKVAKISYSTWNSFRQCDLNVVIHIPGAVQSYILDSKGEIIQIEEAEHDLLWAETFISGVVRSIMMMRDNFEEGEVNSVVETRILNPLSSGEIGDVTEAFIRLFPLVYERGAILGGPCDVAAVSRTNNYLCETLIQVTKMTLNFRLCRDVLESMLPKYPELIVVLVRVLISADMEIDAIQLIHSDLSKNPDTITEYRSELLCVQAQFLLEVKNDAKLALQSAQAAVNCSPSEFRPWYYLVKSYIALNDIENALLTLNGCPMTPLKEKYTFKRVVGLPHDSTSNLHLPLPVDVILDEVTSLNSQDVIQEHRSVDPGLLNLPAANLKSTFQLTYKLLTEIVQRTGWEALLKYRAKMFVMEEEYQGTASPSTKPHGGTLRAKRLCERWLDNLFMLLYEDLKSYTLWQAEQLHFEAQNTQYTKTTFEWELLGLCAYRLGHYREAAKAFQAGLRQRFSAQSCRKLLQFYLKERRQVKTGARSDMTSSQTITTITSLDNRIIDLCVKLCCWNHRWYSEFSVILIDSLAVVIQDMGITKLSNEVASRFPESVVKLVEDNLLDFFSNDTRGDYDA